MKVISGKWQYANGQPVANGRVFFRLSQDAVALATAQIAPALFSITLDSTGSIPVNSLMLFNDELTPANTTYTVSVIESGGGLVYGPESLSITGSAFNVNNAQPTTLNVMLANPVLLNPTAAQIISGFNLSVSGAQLLLSDGSTSAPGYSWINEPTSGWIRNAANDFIYLIAATSYLRLLTTSAILRAGYPLTWASSGIITPDTGISRTAAATMAFGNGTQADQSAVLRAGTYQINSGSDYTLTTGVSKGTSTFVFGWAAGSNATASADTGISRTAAATIAVGNGTQGDASGTVKATTFLGAKLSVQTFIVNGTFTIPAGITAAKVTVVGAGGAGGGATAANNGGGGGSGAVGIKYLSGLTPGNTIAVTVGAGGTGVSQAQGNNGGNSSIASGTQAITTVTGPGGGGGFCTGATSAGGAAGTVATNGDINSGGNGGNTTTTVGAPGAAGVFGGSGQVAGANSVGNAATGPGAGGGGAGAGANNAGGSGNAGIVIFEWVT